jgi:excisionase family DNA binding protein
MSSEHLGRQGRDDGLSSADGDSRANGSPGRLLTAEEVAEILGVTTAWVYEQSRAGRIPTVTLGRYRRYRREAIEAWVAELERSTAGGRPVGASHRGRAA